MFPFAMTDVPFCFIWVQCLRYDPERSTWMAAVNMTDETEVDTVCCNISDFDPKSTVLLDWLQGITKLSWSKWHQNEKKAAMSRVQKLGAKVDPMALLDLGFCHTVVGVQ